MMERFCSTSCRTVGALAFALLPAGAAQAEPFAYVASGVFKSIDGGASWHAMTSGLDLHVLSLVIQPGDEQVVFAGIDDGGGVYKSSDGWPGHRITATHR